jgi:hypothetical protein
MVDGAARWIRRYPSLIGRKSEARRQDLIGRNSETQSFLKYGEDAGRD